MITTGDTLICTHDDLDGAAAMAKQAKQVKCAAPKLAGNCYFGVVVDPAGKVDEIDEANTAAADPGVVRRRGGAERERAGNVRWLCRDCLRPRFAKQEQAGAVPHDAAAPEVSSRGSSTRQRPDGVPTWT